MTFSFTPWAQYFDFYYLQAATEKTVHWIVFPFLCYGVYKLFKAMTR